MPYLKNIESKLSPRLNERSARLPRGKVTPHAPILKVKVYYYACWLDRDN